MSTTWEKVGRAIADAAPVLGSVIGGPAGGAVGAMIASTLGTSASPEAVLEKLKSDPEALMKIKQLEADERQHIRDIQLQTLQAELADVQSARASHKDHWMPSTITILLFLMVCAMAGMLMFYPIPDANRDMCVYLFGAITGLFTSAVSYWIGTSRSSHNKDKVIAGVSSDLY